MKRNIPRRSLLAGAASLAVYPVSTCSSAPSEPDATSPTATDFSRSFCHFQGAKIWVRIQIECRYQVFDRNTDQVDEYLLTVRTQTGLRTGSFGRVRCFLERPTSILSSATYSPPERHPRRNPPLTTEQVTRIENRLFRVWYPPLIPTENLQQLLQTDHYSAIRYLPIKTMMHAPWTSPARSPRHSPSGRVTPHAGFAPCSVGLEPVTPELFDNLVALVERQKPGSHPFQVCAEMHFVSVHGEVGYTAPELEESLTGVTVAPVLLDRFASSFRGEERDS